MVPIFQPAMLVYQGGTLEDGIPGSQDPVSG